MTEPQKRDRILVTGAGGMLGREVCAALGDAACGFTHAELDVTNEHAIHEKIEEVNPVAIINCAAWTDVDSAESHPEAAYALNRDAVRLLATAARDRGIYFFTISSDYVFNGGGEQPWPEDAPEEAFGPLSVYGASKLAGERALKMVGGEWCIVRTQWLYGAGGRNFVDTIASIARERGAAGPPLRVVKDQIGAPSWARDVSQGIKLLVERRATGVYHIANSGYASWFDVAAFIVNHLKLNCPLTPCASAEFPRPARRPNNSRLRQDKYARRAGEALRDWREALAEYLDERKH
jgi:dTDP-4-dehydrorhamnose reductase